MSSAYLAVSYKCNQHCSFCPCSKEEVKYPYVSLEAIKAAADSFVEKQKIDTIVISGGEPTIHPDFLSIISYMTKNLSLHTVVLSNGERYADKEFVNKIKENADVSKLTGITTIHSQNAGEHENINSSKGSFERSISGLKNLCDINEEVIVKHCITKRNYKDLEEFYVFFDKEFPENVSFQLCSIDYCGIQPVETEQHMLSFVELRPYLEKMFDTYIESRMNGSERYMYAINMPFCSCDPYYWDLLIPRAETYTGYVAPNDKGEAVSNENVENNVGTFADVCDSCAAVEVCPGTYRTAFEYFGDRIIEPYSVQEDEEE